MSSPYLEAAVRAEKERDEAYQEIEEARDTIERITIEKAGIIRQRDELKRQLDIALSENCERRKKCSWSYDDADGYWSSSCGVAFYFDDREESLEKHDYNYCHKCGKPINTSRLAPAENETPNP